MEVRPVLALSGISKQFPGVKALSGAGINLYAGEIHTLMGQNGAGKSTLIKVLTGVYAPDSGAIVFDGAPIAPRSTQEAQTIGISTVYQEVNLCPNLSVAENLFIGRYPRRFGMVDWRAMRRDARVLLAQLQVDIDVTRPLHDYPLAVQQMVAIARALQIHARVLILDEPTSSLDEAEVQLLFGVLRRLREQGMAILFVTHFLEQTYAISDRITVMRNGEREGEYLCRELSRRELVNKMVGALASESVDAMAPPPGAAPAAPVLLRARGLAKKGALLPLDLEIHQGEMLGLCGLLGSGRTETARLLFGADRRDAGSLDVAGRPVTLTAPRDAIARGIGFCSEDRKHEGAILDLSVRENLVLALQAKRGMLRAIPLKRQQAMAHDYVAWLGIKTASIETPIGSLSGGNQQKVLLARWLATEPALMILDEPTRGIDVRAKQEIMEFVSTLCRKGMAVLFISSELPEVLRWSDRMLVLRDRKGCGTYLRGELDESTVLHAIAGEAA
ncbi:sugar ABC transporter ATP-binding protein [Massilia sp. S19_KUP03_FR1]|uniref:sugar ABC transporter ATP-binding protein n=1 Tax=Massilia sp. S19_KUP03_FR1 TaxID=3025503 RepID=UPI002FCD7D40